MKRMCLIVIGLLELGVVWAKAPVEERAVQQSAAGSAQLKVDVARRDQSEAARILREAEMDDAEAERKLKSAEKQLSDIRSTRDKARRALEQARAGKSRADEELQKAQSEVERAWLRP